MPDSTGAVRVPPLYMDPLLTAWQHWVLYFYGSEAHQCWAFCDVLDTLQIARRNSGGQGVLYFGPRGA